MSKSHAERNEQACVFLLTSEKFYDWAVTTAFYSALHFVHHQIFPLSEGSIRYMTFDEYYQRFFKSPRNKPSKHLATIRLVDQELSPIGQDYRFLYDNSMTARYRSYQIPKVVAELAKKKLENIKKHCAK